MAIGGINLGQELLNVPMGEMVRSMAMSIADAQWSLDKSSMTVAEMMSGRRVLRDLDTGKLIGPSGTEATEPEILDSRVFFGYSIDLGDDGKPVRRPHLLSMMELGFTPTFYQFVDTIIEVRISISIKSETTTTRDSTVDTHETKDESKSSQSSSHSSSSHAHSNGSTYRYRNRGYNWSWGSSGHSSHGSSASSRSNENKQTVTTSQVNASYAQKYGYSAEGASLLRTKLVPVPPPAILEERIHEIMRIENAYEQWNILYLMRNALEEEVKAAVGTGDTQTAEAKKALMANVDQRLQSALDNLVGGTSS